MQVTSLQNKTNAARVCAGKLMERPSVRSDRNNRYAESSISWWRTSGYRRVFSVVNPRFLSSVWVSLLNCFRGPPEIFSASVCSAPSSSDMSSSAGCSPSGQSSGLGPALSMFRWLEVLEKEFDKAFVDVDLLLGEIDPDQVDITYEGRQKMTSLSSCFAQLCHKSQTVFQLNHKLEVSVKGLQGLLNVIAVVMFLFACLSQINVENSAFSLTRLATSV